MTDEQKRVEAWQKENYARITIKTKKENRSSMEEAAKIAGLSLTAWIMEAVREKLERETGGKLLR